MQISQSFRSTLKEFLKNNIWERGLKNGKRYMKVLKQYLKKIVKVKVIEKVKLMCLLISMWVKKGREWGTNRLGRFICKAHKINAIMS